MSHPRRLAISGAIARNYGIEVDLTPKRKPSKHQFLPSVGLTHSSINQPMPVPTQAAYIAASHLPPGSMSMPSYAKDAMDMAAMNQALPNKQQQQPQDGNGAGPASGGQQPMNGVTSNAHPSARVNSNGMTASPKPGSHYTASPRHSHSGASPSPFGANGLAMPSPPKSANGARIAVPSPAPQQGPPSYNTLPAIERTHRFVITGTLQQSLFGVVKLAFDRTLKRQVAIKISRRELSNKQHTRSGVSVLENVKREASVMKYLLDRDTQEQARASQQMQQHLQSASASASLPHTASHSVAASSNGDSDSVMASADESTLNNNNQTMSTLNTASVTASAEPSTIVMPASHSARHSRQTSSNELQQEESGSRYIAHMICELEDEFFHYVITEFVPAGDLYSMLTSYPQHRLLESQARFFFRQIVKGMRYLHERGVAHCDLSLENICLDVTKDGLECCKLIDMGVASLHPLTPTIYTTNYFSYASSTSAICGLLPPRVNSQGMSNAGNSSGNASSSFLCKPVSELSNKPGKLRYMSSELLSNQAWDAYKNDIFALGVILYSLLTGRPPFSQADSSDVWFNVIYTGQWLTPAIMNQPAAHVYTHLSPEARSLIDDIIKPQEKRPNCDMILQHRWLQMAE